MAADSGLLQGQIIRDPALEEKNVEGLLRGFLRALVHEASGVHAISHQIDSREEAYIQSQAN